MTKQKFALSVFAVAVLALVGCKSASMPNYTISIRDKPTVADVRHAEACLERLPSVLWKPPGPVTVEAGAGFTIVTVPESVLGEMDSSVLFDLAGVNANHPINPVHIQAR